MVVPANRYNDSHRQRVEEQAQTTIFAAFQEARWRYGGDREILIDGDDRRLTYDDLLRAATALGRGIARRTKPKEKVGIFLPSSAGAVIAFLAVTAYGRVPAMLNFTAGIRNIRAACKAAEITQVLTAERFIDKANLHNLASQIANFAELVDLEDLRGEVSKTDKFAAVLAPFTPAKMRNRAMPEAPGVVLFTSGTEGNPKGVVLSHRNVLANVEQVTLHLDVSDEDVLFCPLPTFHCYGLVAGVFFPLLRGIKSVLHPSPLQSKVIPKRIRQTQSTILIATDTFLFNYARVSDKDSMQSLRIAVCGAERVRDETRNLVRKRFGLEVLEGYGVTEAAPVIAANQVGDIRTGTVGRFMAGIDYRVEPVPGLDGVGGRLYVKGPNIMLGYLSVEAPGKIDPPKDGWHDTGDVVGIDEEGYVAIRGRVKRFANIGGEMVSLAVVENCAAAAWPDHAHAAIVAPDPRKGEQIILVTDCQEADRHRLMSWWQSHGVSELAMPRKIIHVDEIPVLGTGKIDYVSVERIARKVLADSPAVEAVRPQRPSVAEVKPDASSAKRPPKPSLPKATQPPKSHLPRRAAE